MFNHKILIGLLVVGLMLSFVMSIVAQDDDTVKLTQDEVLTLAISNGNFDLIVSYPDGWHSIIDDNDTSIQLANNTSLFDLNAVDALEEGDIRGWIGAYRFPDNYALFENEDPIERLIAIYNETTIDDASIDIEIIELRNRDVIYTQHSLNIDIRFYATLIDNVFIYFTVHLPIEDGELETHLLTIEAIFASIDVTTVIND